MTQITQEEFDSLRLALNYGKIGLTGVLQDCNITVEKPPRQPGYYWVRGASSLTNPKAIRYYDKALVKMYPECSTGYDSAMFHFYSENPISEPLG